MREVLHTPFFTVATDDPAAIVFLVRSSVPFSTTTEVRERWLEVNAALDRLGRKGRSLLTDLRLGPARNEPDFERAVQDVVPLIHTGFRRNAVLVRMAVGALQIRRHAKSDGIERLVTDSEEDALAYLREGRPSSTSHK